jgi:hypothetical protein
MKKVNEHHRTIERHAGDENPADKIEECTK